MSTQTRFGQALAQGVDRVRTELGKPMAAVLVVGPMDANMVHARRELALTTNFLRVYFATPTELVRSFGRVALADDPRRLEPTSWLAATVATRVLADPFAHALRRHIETLRLPGWAGELARAVKAVEGAGVTPDELDATGDERAAIVAATVRAVERARAEDGIYGEGALVRWGLQAIRQGGRSVYSDIGGVVMFGDGELPALVHRGLREFASTRRVFRLAAKPFDDLAAVPLGLRDAVGEVPEMQVDCAAGSLGHLQMNWGRHTSRWEGERESVVLAATPDDAREGREAVRRVLDAIDAGVPLDRIAIAVPDADSVEEIEALLESAGVPATLLTGPSIANTSEARLLRHALALADGGDDIVSWYELLMTPGLLNQGVFRGIPTDGRGRWRRLLASCGASTGTHRIRAALERMSEEQAVSPDYEPAEFAAVESLLDSFTAFADELAKLPEEATLGEHADAWRALLKAHTRYSIDRRTLESVLDGWGRPGVGVPVALSTARVILEDALSERSRLKGSLLERAVVVGPPMALYGRDFELVCVCGLNQGRLPRDFQEDLLLTDETIEKLNRNGRRFLTTEEVETAEVRRFTGALAAASGAVWLSSPRTDLDGRTTLPSTFMLDAASALAGERVSFEDLSDWMTRIGSRSSFTDSPSARAVTAAEYRVAKLSEDPSSYLPVLAKHRWARGQLQLLRSIDKFAAGGLPDAWTGRISEPLPDPVLGDGAAPAHVFAQAVDAPGKYLFQRLLGGWAAKRMYPSFDARSFRVAAKLSESAYREALNAAGFDERRFGEAFEQAFREETEFQPVDDGADDASRRLAEEIIDDSRNEASAHFEPSASISEQVVDIGHGWQVEVGEDELRTSGVELLKVDRVRGGRYASFNLSDGDLKWAIEAIAAQQSGERIESVTVLDMSKPFSRSSGAFGPVEAEARELIEAAVRRTKVRYYPVGDGHPYALSGETIPDSERLAEIVSALEGGEQ